jgi:glycosyltransferase involved in cell wall biosynthesis
LFSLFSKWIAFHATNEVEKSQIQNKFKKNKGVYNLPNFMPIASNSYNGNNGEVLFLGRLNQIKNLESLIEAIFILKSEFGKEVKLSISGEARIESEKAYKQNLINLVEKLKVNKLITFLGQTEGIDKITLLKDSCCLVLPSKSENFGNVVIEALSCGTPVIASLGTPWGALEKEGVGFWVEPSPKAIADKINFYLNLRKDEYIKIGYNAKKYVLDNFEISRNIYKWKKLYNEL